MKRTLVLPKSLAVFLSLALGLPGGPAAPAESVDFVARPELVEGHSLRQAGLEQNSAKEKFLQAIRYSKVAAGTEEEVLLYPIEQASREALDRKIRRLDKRGFGDWKEEKAKEEVRRLKSDFGNFLVSYVGGTISQETAEHLISALFYSSLNREVLSELLGRLKRSSSRTLSEIRTVNRNPRALLSGARGGILERYYSGISLSAAAASDLFVSMQGMVVEKETSRDDLETFLKILESSAGKSSSEVNLLKRKLRETSEEITTWCQWDFVHRFKGAYGIRLFHGSKRTLGNPHPGEKLRIFGNAYLTFLPDHAYGFSANGSMLVVDVPLECLELVSWVFYPDETYESEILVSGEVLVRRNFLMTRVEDLRNSFEYRQAYMRNLGAIPYLDPRDLKNMESETPNDWIIRLMQMEIEELVGQKIYTTIAYDFLRIAQRILSLSQRDYERGLAAIRRVINEASSQSASRIQPYLQEQLRRMDSSKSGRDLLEATGMEEKRVGQFIQVLSKVILSQPGVLVIEAGEISRRIGLEEFVARVPKRLGQRLVLFGEGSLVIKELAVRNGIAVVDSDRLSDLAFQLMVLGGEADQVGYLGNPVAATALARMLPMEVTPLDPKTTLDKLLSYLGYTGAVLEELNAAGAEELFAGARAA